MSRHLKKFRSERAAVETLLNREMGEKQLPRGPYNAQPTYNTCLFLIFYISILQSSSISLFPLFRLVRFAFCLRFYCAYTSNGILLFLHSASFPNDGTIFRELCNVVIIARTMIELRLESKKEQSSELDPSPIY